MSKLYENVQIDVPQSKTMSRNTGGLPIFRPDVIRSMRKLSIRDRIMDFRDPVYNRGRRSDAGSVDGYICDILARIPHSQLSSFSYVTQYATSQEVRLCDSNNEYSYLHKAPLTSRMLNLLTTAHGSQLRELKMYELETFHTVGDPMPESLTLLECRSINDRAAWGRLVQNSAASLHTLRFGQEKE